MEVWIVLDEMGVFLGCFANRDLCMESIRITYNLIREEVGFVHDKSEHGDITYSVRAGCRRFDVIRIAPKDRADHF